MGRSWFSQTSNIVQSIHELIVVCERNQWNEKDKIHLFELIFKHSESWLSDEAFTNGITQRILDIFENERTKVKIHGIETIIQFLIVHSLSISTSHYQLLLEFIKKNTNQTAHKSKKIAKKITQCISTGYTTSPSFLHTVLSILPFHPSFYSNTCLYLNYLFDQNKSEVVEQTLELPCRCTSCLYLSKEKQLLILQEKDISQYRKVLKMDLHAYPYELSIQLTSSLIDSILSYIFQSTTKDCFPTEFLMDCFSYVDRNKIIECIETLWNHRQFESSIDCLSILLSHSSLLSFQDVLFILNQMISEATPSFAIIRMFSHILITHSSSLSHTFTSSQQLQQIFAWITAVPSETLTILPSHIRWILSKKYHSFYTFCCSRWCCHLCSSCQNQTNIILQSFFNCPFCSSNFTSVLTDIPKESSCLWKEGEEKHTCPVCHYDCCQDHIVDNKPYKSCLCDEGKFPLAYNYELFDSESESEMEFEEKRIHIQTLNELTKQMKEKEYWWNHMNLDVLLNICSFLPISSIVEFGRVNNDMKIVVSNEWLWKCVYLRLFRNYHCQHDKKYKHVYSKLVKRRIASMNRWKKNEILCNYCGCCRRFCDLEAYRQHVVEKHSKWIVC